MADNVHMVRAMIVLVTVGVVRIILMSTTTVIEGPSCRIKLNAFGYPDCQAEAAAREQQQQQMELLQREVEALTREKKKLYGRSAQLSREVSLDDMTNGSAPLSCLPVNL